MRLKGERVLPSRGARMRDSAVCPDRTRLWVEASGAQARGANTNLGVQSRPLFSAVPYDWPAFKDVHVIRAPQRRPYGFAPLRPNQGREGRLTVSTLSGSREVRTEASTWQYWHAAPRRGLMTRGSEIVQGPRPSQHQSHDVATAALSARRICRHHWRRQQGRYIDHMYSEGKRCKRA